MTEHTFDGAGQLQNLAPADAYALYRGGDGCEGNPWYGHLKQIGTY